MLDLSRSQSIFPQERVSNLNVLVVGAGGIGSNIVNILARIGVQKISVFDNDLVAEANIAPGWFRKRDIGKLKVDVLKSRCKNELGVSINAVSHRFTVEGGTYDLVIVGVDRIIIRKMIWENGYLHYRTYIDFRMGFDQMEMYTVLPDDDARKNAYWTTINQQENELPCGEKATAALTVGIIPGMLGAAVWWSVHNKKFPWHVFYKMGELFWTIQQEPE